MEFWATGFWATGFWATGFWAGEVAELPDSPPGRKVRRRPRTVKHGSVRESRIFRSH